MATDIRTLAKTLEAQIKKAPEEKVEEIKTIPLRVGTLEFPEEIALGFAFGLAQSKQKTEKEYVQHLLTQTAKRNLKKLKDAGVDISTLDISFSTGEEDAPEDATTTQETADQSTSAAAKTAPGSVPAAPQEQHKTEQTERVANHAEQAEKPAQEPVKTTQQTQPQGGTAKQPETAQNAGQGQGKKSSLFSKFGS